MKNKVVLLSMVTLASAPVFAAAAIHQVTAFPPGPYFWALIVRLFGG